LYDDPFNFLGQREAENRGIYVTTNTGSSWTKVGVDSTVILGLVSYGDTTFALTQDRGLFAMKSTGVLSDAQDEITQIPVNVSLLQNFPNPFNPRTTIRYQVPSTVRVSLRVYNLLGQEVAKLVDEEKTGGEHEVSLDASRLSSGIYFYRIVAGSFTQTRKLVLLK